MAKIGRPANHQQGSQLRPLVMPAVRAANRHLCCPQPRSARSQDCRAVYERVDMKE
nr:MAG TPA: hypothetical protein [Caudoviricetes sp.]